MLKSTASRIGVGCLAAALATAQAIALDGPEEPVRAIYRHGQPDTVQEADRFLARDVARRYKVDLLDNEPQPSTDFDWRYGSQEYEVTDLVVGRAVDLPPVDGVIMRDVPVSFRSFNQGPYTVTWTLCLGRRGWRVANVRSSDTGGGWNLREMLELTDDKVQC